MADEYNGWTNRETWALKLHLDNTESSQAWLRETARLAGENAEASKLWTVEEAKVFATEDAIRDAVETAFERALYGFVARRGSAGNVWEGDDCGETIGMHDASDVYRMIADVSSLWRVDFCEIARHVVEEYVPT